MNNESFNDLVRKVNKIRIPKIQRDYAQGRENPDVNEIRRTFVRNLMSVIMGRTEELELDFIYGSEKDGAFEPLDGQQRITTLFLLYWFFGAKLTSADDESVLTYETRYTSRRFCNNLALRPSLPFIMESRNAGKKPSEIIRRRDWFQWEWRYDPTVKSMLVMLDAIYDEFNLNNGDVDNLEFYRQNLENIKFNFLDLDELKMSDELFVKMNARGKRLSDFDKVKSTLEEELQMQNVGGDIETLWRTLMDRDWADLFWQRYAKNKAKDETTPYEIISSVETNMRRFILRVIATYLFAKISDDTNELKKAAYEFDEPYIGSLLTNYNEYLYTTKMAGEGLIDFRELIDNINAILYKDGASVVEISTLLHDDAYMEAAEPGEPARSYFDLLCEQDKQVGNDFKVIYFASMEYAKFLPHQNTMTDAWKNNYEHWMKFIRNVFKADNRQERFDNISDVSRAFSAVKSLVRDVRGYLAINNLDYVNDEHAIEKYIANLDLSVWSKSGINIYNLEEEKWKASLCLDSDEWEEALHELELNHYLWGQIGAFIEWSKDASGAYNISRFRSYSKVINKILVPENFNENSNKYYLALLLITPNFWQDKNRLYEFNKQRDNGIKRYLHRDKESGEENGIAIKNLLDEWINWNEDATPSEFYDYAISKFAPSTDWLYVFKLQPEIFTICNYKRIYIDQDGFMVFAERKTTDGHCHDPILLCVKSLCEGAGIDCSYADSKAEDTNSVKFSVGGDNYAIRRGAEPNNYGIYKNDIYAQTFSGKEMLNHVQGLLGIL